MLDKEVMKYLCPKFKNGRCDRYSHLSLKLYVPCSYMISMCEHGKRIMEMETRGVFDSEAKASTTPPESFLSSVKKEGEGIN